MHEDQDQLSSRQAARLLARLDRMVTSGQITAMEAAQLRASEGTPAFDDAVRMIRTRHAAARLDAAVDEGAMTEAEAASYRTRLERGEHPRSLRAHLGRLRRKG
jgi:hypothetical protein